MKRTILALVLVAFIAAGAAQASTTNPRLSQVASVFAMRPVESVCYKRGELGDPLEIGAWGYVFEPTALQSQEHFAQEICDGASSVNDSSVPAWKRAIGVLVLVHESYHLRRWGAAGDEAQVECAAIRHFKVGTRLLGASEETVAVLFPYAMAFHYELTGYVDIFSGKRPYFDPDCKEPRIAT